MRDAWGTIIQSKAPTEIQRTKEKHTKIKINSRQDSSTVLDMQTASHTEKQPTAKGGKKFLELPSLRVATHSSTSHLRRRQRRGNISLSVVWRSNQLQRKDRMEGGNCRLDHVRSRPLLGLNHLYLHRSRFECGWRLLSVQTCIRSGREPAPFFPFSPAPNAFDRIFDVANKGLYLSICAALI